MDIPESYIIHDTRIGKDFKGITICGYKRKDVLNAYQNSMINNNLEDAIRWCVELHATGLNAQIWDCIKNVYFRYIHINNPKFLFYLLRREKDYQNIINKYPKKHEIFSRNNQEIRNLYAELTAISVLTKKNNIFLQKSLPVINNKSFGKEDIHKRMISKDLDRLTDYIFNSTTKEMKLALNEIINNIYMKNGTFQNCIYWYLWLEKIENLKKKEKENDIVFSKISDNEDNWNFILWNIILEFSEKYIDKNNLLFIKKLHNDYKRNFKISDVSKKKYYFFIIFYIIKNIINWNINIFQQEHNIIQTNANINKMYENIIKNIESSLSHESKQQLYKNYNTLFYNINNTETVKLKKVINTNLDDEINVVSFTNYPEYNDIKRGNNDNTRKSIEAEKIISKNMTQRDIEKCKEEKIDNKLNAFTQFIVYKKEEKPKIKNILVPKLFKKNTDF